MLLQWLIGDSQDDICMCFDSFIWKELIDRRCKGCAEEGEESAVQRW